MAFDANFDFVYKPPKQKDRTASKNEGSVSTINQKVQKGYRPVMPFVQPLLMARYVIIYHFLFYKGGKVHPLVTPCVKYK